jgi:hypothetical protein
MQKQSDPSSRFSRRLELLPLGSSFTALLHGSDIHFIFPRERKNHFSGGDVFIPKVPGKHVVVCVFRDFCHLQ